MPWTYGRSAWNRNGGGRAADAMRSLIGSQEGESENLCRPASFVQLVVLNLRACRHIVPKHFKHGRSSSFITSALSRVVGALPGERKGRRER